MFKAIKKNIETEIVEKKSRFICNIFYAKNETEAEARINEIRKKYHNARHNCYAYKIVNGNIAKSSDDGEPSGTAGAPILSLIEGYELNNIVIIVTRYFGGILLGTGGLVRAYSESAKKAIEQSQISTMEVGNRYRIDCTYDDLKDVQYILKNNEIKIDKLEYLEKINIEFSTQEEKKLIVENALISKKIDSSVRKIEENVIYCDEK